MSRLIWLLMALPLMAQPPIVVNRNFPKCTPQGTTFSESFGDSSRLCYASGPSTCDQTWALTGTGQSIVASPGATSSPWCGNALRMNTTTGTAYTTGTFPSLPSGSTYTLTFTLRVASHSIANFGVQQFFAIANVPGGSTGPLVVKFRKDSTNLYLAATGTGQSLSGYTQAVTLNADHTVTVSVNGASSTLTLDAGTPVTFTSGAYAATHVVFGFASATAATDYYIGNIKIDSSLGGFSNPSMFTDFAGASDGTTVTAALLNSGTHCGNGTWSGTVSSEVFSTVSASSLHSGISTCGSSYAGNTGLTLRHLLSSTNKPLYAFTTINPAASVGFFWQSNLQNNEAAAAYDIAALTTSDTGSWVITQVATGTALYLRLEVLPSTTFYGTLTVQPDTLYWISVDYTAGGAINLKVYETATWTLLNSASGPAQTAGIPMVFAIGHVGGATSGAGKYFYYGNLILDYSSPAHTVTP